MNNLDKKVFIFDSECIMCDSFINYLIDRDIEGKIMFSSLDGKFAKGLELSNLLKIKGQSAVFVDGGKCYTQSEAILRVLETINFGKILIPILKIMPKGVADFIYSFVARNRYRILGKKKSCDFLRKDVKRFID